MKPQPKSKAIDELLEAISGDSRTGAIMDERCLNPPIGCGKSIVDVSVHPQHWSEMERSEYEISGLCKDCQDKIFGQGD